MGNEESVTNRYQPSGWDEKQKASELIGMINHIIEELDRHHKNVNISRVTGSSVAIVTGGTAAGLAIAAPFTLGATLIPAVVLGIVSAVSGAVSAGASIAEFFIEKNNVKEVQRKWEDFRDTFFENHSTHAKQVKEMSESLIAETGVTRDTAGRVVSGARVLSGAGDAARTAAGIAGVAARVSRPAARAVKVAAPALIVVNILLLPLDFIDLITAAFRLHKGKRSPAAESLEAIVEFLKRVANCEFDGLTGEDCARQIVKGAPVA